jgi:hypothetical protein
VVFKPVPRRKASVVGIEEFCRVSVFDISEGWSFFVGGTAGPSILIDFVLFRSNRAARKDVSVERVMCAFTSEWSDEFG